jgi:hypothetical protein
VERELLGVLADTLDIASREKLLGLRVFSQENRWVPLVSFFLLGNVDPQDCQQDKDVTTHHTC